MEIALFRPEIPPNTGNIARLCFCTGSQLHLIGEPSFSLDAARLRRAGLDYWEQMNVCRHADWESFILALSERPVLLFSRFASQSYSDYDFQGNEILVFGRESSGLPEDIVASVARQHPSRVLRIPVGPACRSLNLSNAVAVVLYEALRQTGFPGLDQAGPDQESSSSTLV